MVKQTPQSLRQALLAFVALIALVYTETATAQGAPNSQGGPSEQRMQSAIRVSKSGGATGTTANIAGLLNSVPSLPGVDPLKNTKEGGENKEADLGRNVQVNNNIILPPLKGFRQLAAAKPIKEMYQELINKDVPVLFQTMMMVENGAATGFIGSLGAVSNLMNNTIQTQQFQLQLMDLTDTTGQMKYAYAGGIQKAFNDKQAQTWPQALFLVNGDSHKGTMGNFDKLKENSEPFTLIALPSNQAAGKQPSGDGKKVKLSEILFIKEANNNGNSKEKHQNDKIDELKKEYNDFVGDLEIEIQKGEGSDQVGRLVKVNYQKPNQQDDKGRWGLQKQAYKHSDSVWKNLNKMLNKLCKWKKGEGGNTNKGKGYDETKTPANIPDFYPPDVLKGASAPDITVNAILIDKIWNQFFPKQELKDVQCDQEFRENSKFPDATNFQAPQNTAEDCKSTSDDEVKPCLRNRIMVHIATVIGRSRAYHSYLNLQLYSQRFAKDSATAQLNRQLFTQIIGDGRSLDELLDDNLDMWIEFDHAFGRFAQSTMSSGSGLGVVQKNNLPNQRSGGDTTSQ